MRMRWLDMCLVATAVIAAVLLLAGSGMTAALAAVLFLSCPVAMVFVATSMARHGSRH